MASAVSIKDAKEYHRRGDLNKAWSLYEQLLLTDPDNAELLHLTSLLCIQQGDFLQAAERIIRAKNIVPDSHILSYNLGIAWMRQERWADAQMEFQAAIRLRPDYVNALCQLGRVLLRQQKDAEALMVLNKAVRLESDRAEIHELLSAALRSLGMLDSANYRIKLARYYGKVDPDINPLPKQHTFFVDRERAANVARQNNLVQESIQTTGLQVCYYMGEPGRDLLPNLVPVPMAPQEAVTFLCHSTLTLPTEIDFNPAIEAERIAGSRMASILNNVRQARISETRRLGRVCHATRPTWIPGEPLRVYLPASRHGDVLMYNARDLANGFRKNGCDALYFVEPDKTETFHFHHWLQAQIAFNPHIVIDINNAFNLASDLSFQSHPDVFRVLWFEDPTPAILAGNPMPWRPRDLVYSISKELDILLYQCGATNVRRQGFCYDEEIFQDFCMPRKNKVVFVGSSHDFVLGHIVGHERLLTELEEIFAAGEPITNELLDQFSGRFPYQKENIFNFFWGYVVRNVSIRWLCELSDEIEVEVFGHRWESNAAVRPFYKGILPHGPAVAGVYNEARYVLVPHPFDLRSQRLTEVSACGAIPIVYDCRYRAEEPHWDDHCLWYRTKEEMRACLTGEPAASPRALCHGRSYTEFAKRILTIIESRLTEDRP
ncbi:MAG: hypothetical protein H7838_06240 [Magnetococcus sp. DMHC-8]